MLFNIGCDSGYGYTMSKSALSESRFSSYIEKVKEHQANSIKQGIDSVDEDNILVKFGDDYYIMGRLCERHNMDSSRRVELNRVGDTFHLVQLLTSIALNAKDTNNINVNLMVGLPMRSKNDRDEFINWLQGNKFTLTFLSNSADLNKTITINKCHCSLQPVFPIFSTIGLENTNEKNILSLDIGYSSTDGVRFEDGGMSESNQDQIDLVGAKRIMDELEEEIVAKYGSEYKHIKSVPERTLQAVLELGIYSINGKQVDISDILSSSFESYADYLFKEIQRRYTQKLPDIDIVLVSGGLACSQIFMREIAAMFKRYGIAVQTSVEPQWDICRGMFILLNMVEEDDFNGTINEAAVVDIEEEEAVGQENTDIPKAFRGFKDVVGSE